MPERHLFASDRHVSATPSRRIPIKKGRSPFEASSRQKALEFFARLKERWQKDIPSAVRCLENSLGACLTFFDFPEDEWISLRTTNVIERLNKEFKRRTRTMEILAGENACHTPLAFLSIKMEVH
ncbi:MAG: hypothetical protein CO103_03410 [Chloroflexi bacterium CG_4_9_14_3_um_filter_45_9]|nr:MAG: hypothetical protein CO103_03410 [Chloroflexi bacterium CG_4_9_14_3_um_filter_45_9]